MKEKLNESPWIEIQIALLAAADVGLIALLIYIVYTLTSFLADFIPKFNALM